MTVTLEDRSVLTAGSPIEEREANLASGADELSGGRRLLAENPRLLVTIAASTMTMGLTAILLGWFGAARSTLLEEQIPYLISGGLLGLALSTIGALLLFTHWLTVSIRESRERELVRRRDHAELIGVLRNLTSLQERQEHPNGRTRGERPQRPLRRSPGGS